MADKAEDFEEIRSVAVEYDDLLISSEEYDEKTNAEARRAIKLILDQMTFGVSVEAVSYDRASRQLDDENPLADKVRGKAIIHGVTWVIGNVDGTDDTGEIKYGRPVVFDTTTGKCVTGINPKWSADEYKVLGTALDSLKAGKKRIPVMLGTPPSMPGERRFVHCFDFLHASFGGFAAVDSDSIGIDLARSYKNYIDDSNKDSEHPTTVDHQILYFAEATVCSVRNGQIVETDEKIQIANPDRIPMQFPFFGWVSKVGDAWLVDRNQEIPPEIVGYWYPASPDLSTNAIGEDGIVGLNQIKIMRRGPTAFSAVTLNNFAGWLYLSPGKGDIFIRQGGTYQIDWGVVVVWQRGPLYGIEGGGPDTGHAGTPDHIHSTKRLLELDIATGFLVNYMGSSSPVSLFDAVIDGIPQQTRVSFHSVSTLQPDQQEFRGSTASVVLPPFGPHGQPYARISSFVGLLDNGSVYPPSDRSLVKLRIIKTWIRVRAGGGHAYYSAGIGMNPFLGEKTESNPTGFQWWGGGPEPTYLFNAEGVLLPSP